MQITVGIHPTLGKPIDSSSNYKVVLAAELVQTTVIYSFTVKRVEFQTPRAPSEIWVFVSEFQQETASIVYMWHIIQFTLCAIKKNLSKLLEWVDRTNLKKERPISVSSFSVVWACSLHHSSNRVASQCIRSSNSRAITYSPPQTAPNFSGKSSVFSA